MDFSTDPPSKQSLAGGITVISNTSPLEGYIVRGQSSASWGGTSSLDPSGDTFSANEFAIKAGAELDLSTAVLLSDSPSYEAIANGTLTSDAGYNWDIFLFLKLADAFNYGSYSGTITFSAY